MPTRKITIARSDLEHAVRRGRGKRPRRVLDAADLDRVPEIVRRPMAVLQDRPNGTLVYVGRASDGRRLVKVVIRTGRTRDPKTGLGPAKSVPTNYVRTLGYEEPSSLRGGDQWRLLDGSVEG